MANEDDEGPTEPKRSVLSIDSFAHRRGADRALQAFRDRQATEKQESARQNRSYRKALKQEGYDPKQQRTDRKNNGSKRKRGEFYTAEKQAEYRKQKSEEKEAAAKEREKQKQQALHKRRQRHRNLTARTKKGQPIMKNIVHDILDKLQKERSDP